MIADRSNGNVVQSTMTGEKIEMSIDLTSMPHIMNVLTDLYKNRVAAIIREYSTNGRDAHIEAGIDRPIEVKLPTPFTQTLRIQDFGVGLTVDDIHEIYSKYGASTKRTTNDQTGMLGLGCKSALTYADQFTVTSVKDGTKVVVVVSRNDEGAGVMQVLDTVRTDDENGTEIMVPTLREDTDRFRSEAAEFFATWPEGTVLVDGKVPESFETRWNAKRLDDDLYIIEGGQSKVVMGGVTYPADIDLGVFGVNLLAFVPIGSVVFPADREGLTDTAKTKATLAKIATRYHKLIDASIQREVDAAKTAPEALRVRLAWDKYVPNGKAGSYTYKGDVIPRNYAAEPVDTGKVDDYGDPVMRVMQTAALGYGRGSTDISAVVAANWPNTLWIKNFVPLKLNKQHKDKAKKFCKDNGIDLDALGVTTLVTDPTSGPTSPFIDPRLILDWPDAVKKVELEPRARNGRAPRVPGSYTAYVDGGEYENVKDDLPGDDIDLTNPVLWIHGNQFESRYEARALARVFPKFTLVCLPGGRIEKFRRILPQAQNWRDGIAAAGQKWAEGLTAEQRRAFAFYDSDENGDHLLAELDPKLVDDPAIKDAIKVATFKLGRLPDQRAAYTQHAPIPRVYGDDYWKSPMEAYPLAHHYRGRVCDHLYLYLNSAYAAAQEAAA